MSLLRGSWRQGEHVTLLGSSGSGKTLAASRILDLRQYVLAIATKPRDENLEALVRRRGYYRAKRWPVDPRRHPRVVFWPPSGGLSEIEQQSDAILDVMDDVWHSGGWALYFDEVDEITNALGLERETKRMLRQSRSSKVSVVGATQRPRGIPLEFYSQATHLFFWQQNDKADLDRIADIGGQTNRAAVRDTVATLQRFQVCYVNTRTGAMWKSLPPPP